MTEKQLVDIANGLADLRAWAQHIHGAILRVERVAVQLELSRLREEPRVAEPGRLERSGFKVYSQSDEDGIIAEIFRRIGAGHKSFAEIGCGEGGENNTRYLLHSGWTGGWIDGDPANINQVRRDFAVLIGGGDLRVSDAIITAENVEQALLSVGTPAEPDLLSIDIDGNDYHVWNAVASFSPRVVIVEYNAKFVPPLVWIMPYDPSYRWNQTDCHGASLEALVQLAERKGYVLVGCNITGTNAFFVRRDQLGGHFARSSSAADHHHPLRLDLIPGIASCHPAGAFTPSGWPEV